jgi:alanine racemase
LPPAAVSIGSSAGIFLGSQYCGDLVRPGISIYGGRPLAGQPNPMQEVVRLTGGVIQTREITAPTPVGYGATYMAAAGSTLATVGLGYADGYPRSLGNVGVGLVGGQRVPVVGRVSMDSLVVDVSALPPGTVQEGSEVTLIGDGLSIDEVAAGAGTISYELLTGLGRRPRRSWSGS